MRAWDIRGAGRTPSPGERALARSASGCGLLQVDLRAGTARLGHPAAGVEEGGFLKGYALDRALEILRKDRVPRGWLDFGGQILAWGQSRAAGVASPDDRGGARLGLRVPASRSLSSSGCSERGRHILDPLTGEPCPDWGAVAVVAGRALDADVLSTALYVMGPERGLDWARRNGVAAAFLLHGGEVRQTPAFARVTL